MYAFLQYRQNYKKKMYIANINNEKNNFMAYTKDLHH